MRDSVFGSTSTAGSAAGSTGELPGQSLLVSVDSDPDNKPFPQPSPPTFIKALTDYSDTIERQRQEIKALRSTLEKTRVEAQVQGDIATVHEEALQERNETTSLLTAINERLTAHLKYFAEREPLIRSYMDKMDALSLELGIESNELKRLLEQYLISNPTAEDWTQTIETMKEEYETNLTSLKIVISELESAKEKLGSDKENCKELLKSLELSLEELQQKSTSCFPWCISLKKIRGRGQKGAEGGHV